MLLKRRYIAGLILALLIAINAVPVPSRAEGIDESAKYKLHAVFLYNFISSVEWPKLVYSGTAKNIDLCIIGKDPMGAVIDAVAKKAESKGDIKINIRRGVTASEINTCNIAYISSSEAANSEAIIAKAKDNAVLTVSEIKDFVKEGGIIEFVLKGSGVSFNVNNKSAREYGLKISPQLLEVASEVIN